ncbi:FAD-dependent pyridine nucleotide-disulphide oxidoreductase [Paraburkholderia ribeironis]|uniref:FAD-dependent pyridine nucleotide-disulphide oxidoreductase n=1 Tax=Paraburkholderia ribeironis TaxID=1247936 RepID=A0A1N7S9V7_9BURK|nr:NAD(P)-binding domain-containing protein [Paraburkholderia ribeironis]SIT43758.1 FAD-dependent pyridine nucleotide-disulphide oxidoreductase [Paraburkholderia ribeironis]
MRNHVDIAIVGAGPFGLSIAAHLRGSGRSFRIFGNPMQSWRTQMPKGMQLKSAGFSSTICDPGRVFTLRHFCREQGIPYHDVGLPVRLDTFSAYGLAFQQRFVPELEDVRVDMLEQSPKGFALRLDNGEALTARKVVLAVGVDYFRHIPESLIHLPTDRISHSAEHHVLDRFHGQHVTVLGAGASAFDLGVLLREAGATALVIARRPAVKFNPDEPLKRGLRESVLRPMSGVGPGWKQRICTDVMPRIYRYLPDDTRVRTVKEFLGPSVGWFMRERAMSVPLLLGQEIDQAEFVNDRIQLQLRSTDGKRQSVVTDHVIAATGYRNDVRRLSFLSPVIVGKLQLLEQSPRLSAYFESSVGGLYFTGPISATSFGPVMRFAYGVEFTAPRIVRHLAA